MASKKRQSMLSRQRQLRNQQQQVRQASSKQLPPKGGSSAGSKPARIQRADTAKAQAANTQRVVTRGIQGFIRRGQANDKADKAARGTGPSGTTRTAGAGGGLARRPESRPAPTNKPGALTRRGAVKPAGSSAATNGRIERVSVRDVTPKKPAVTGSKPSSQLPAAQQGPNPPSRRQAAQSRADAAARGTTGPNRVGQPAGSANRIYGANRVNAAVDRAVSGANAARRINVGRGQGAVVALSIANAIQDKLLSPQQLKTKRANEINKDSFYADNNPLKPKPAAPKKPAPKATAAQISALTDKGGIFNLNGTGNVKKKAQPTTSNSSGGSGGGSSRGSSGGPGRGGGGGGGRPQAPKPARFTGTVDEGRRIWAEKYSSDKYKGQAIHKEATKALENMKNNEFGKRAQNIGKSGASPATNFESKTKIDEKKIPDYKKIKGRQFGK